MKRSDLIFTVAHLPLDFLMLLSAGFSTYLLRTQILDTFRPVLFEFNLPLERFMLLVFGVSIMFIGALAISGLYSVKRRGMLDEFLRILVASSAGIMVIILFIFLRQELFNSRFLVVGGWILSIIFLTFGRILMRLARRHFVVKYDVGSQKVLIIGKDGISERIVEKINKDPALGYRIVKRLDNPEIEEIRLAVGSPGIHEVILADINYPQDKVVQMVDFCHENHLVFRFVPNLYQTLTTNYSFDTSTGLPLLELRRTSLDGWGRVAKRLMDTFGAIVGFVIFSPLFLIISLAIKLETKGPIFVKLKRVTQKREFFMYKFRSMVDGADKMKESLIHLNERVDGPLFKIKNDPRITRVGRFIRKYRIDELAQFLNVLKGEMSLIGPRPHEPGEIAKYEKHHKKVLGLKAGMTGMAQASGSSDLNFEDEVKMDTYYVENWSLFFDIKILIKTLLRLLVDRSAT